MSLVIDSLAIDRDGDTGAGSGGALIRHDWSREEVRALFALPFPELMFRAQSVHRAHFDPTEVQISTLLSIKTGGCPEDCAYCPQSAHFDTGAQGRQADGARGRAGGGARRQGVGREPVLHGRRLARAQGPRPRQGVRDGGGRPALGLETCVTLGMLDERQARRLKAAGLDYYNHNLDTSPEYYGDIITTRTYQERLDTLGHVREAGIHVCCGGIVGMGESPEDRVGMIATLANLPVHPESVPINLLVKVEGTPLAERPTRGSIRSTSCAPSRSPASPCRRRWSGCPPAART